MERRLFGKYMLFKDEPETETLKADYVSKAVDKLLHDFTGNGIIPDWETMQIIVKEGFNILNGPDWYEEEKEDYKGPYVGWMMTVGIKFYSENYPDKQSDTEKQIEKDRRKVGDEMDREKVIGGLVACTGEKNDCAGHTCPYWDFDDSKVDWGCREQMELDALALLKEPKAKRIDILHELVSDSILMYQGKEIVRCKDCKHQVDRGRMYKECDAHFLWAKDDWFCADGDRKVGEVNGHQRD